jgi:hypothetical protein
LSKREKLVEVYRAQGEPEAQLIKGLLECEGIPVLLKYESAGRVYGLTVDGMGEVKVMVWEKMADAAKSLIEERDNA